MIQSIIYERKKKMENNAKQYDTSMYKSLCICSSEFEKIPIHRRELGMARNVATYGAIGSKV